MKKYMIYDYTERYAAAGLSLEFLAQIAINKEKREMKSQRWLHEEIY